MKVQRVKRAREEHGFTLIELMIVVAIIGILAAIAVPQYQDYVTRSRWQDAFAVMASTKAQMAECIQSAAGDPTNCDTDAKIQTANGGIFTMPTIASNGNVAIARGAFTAGTNGVGGTAVFTLTGNSVQMAGCVVTMVGTVATHNVSWTFTNSGAGCSRYKTGVGT